MAAQYNTLQRELANVKNGGGSENWKEKDRNDPARKQAVVLGWPEEVEAAQRLNTLEDWVKHNFQDFRPVTYSNEHKGPHNKRYLGKASYVHFGTEDEVKDFAKAVKTRGKKLEVQGKELRVTAAKTARNRQRDWALTKAEELLPSGASWGVFGPFLLFLRILVGLRRLCS